MPSILHRRRQCEHPLADGGEGGALSPNSPPSIGSWTVDEVMVDSQPSNSRTKKDALSIQYSTGWSPT